VDLRRLRAGEWLAAAAGVLLIISLLVPWYEDDSGDVTGFEALTIIDLALAALALLAISLAVVQATHDSPTRPVAAGVLCVTFGILGIVLVLFRLVDQPQDGLIGLGIGAWLALAATVAITAGGWLSIANEHVRGLPPDREPELRPAPDG
jgi:uncharacterized membrane protein